MVGGSITAEIDMADGYSDIGLAMGTEQMNLGQMHDYRTIIPLLLFISSRYIDFYPFMNAVFKVLRLSTSTAQHPQALPADGLMILGFQLAGLPVRSIQRSMPRSVPPDGPDKPVIAGV